MNYEFIHTLTLGRPREEQEMKTQQASDTLSASPSLQPPRWPPHRDSPRSELRLFLLRRRKRV